jgi:hypothetical protein
MLLKAFAVFMESHGIVDSIYWFSAARSKSETLR